MERDLPKYITRTKYGYHVRMEINGEYHAKHFVEEKYEEGEAFEKAKEKRQELIELRKRTKKPRPTEYETRFLYENGIGENSTGITGIFYTEDEGRAGAVYPYYCTTITPEKGKPKSYSRSIKKWGKAEALLQICCIRKRHMVKTYPDRFDQDRFDKAVINYMKENYLSYRDEALERLSKYVGE